MNKVTKIFSCIAFVFAFCFMAIGYAAVQDTLTVGGSVSVKANDKIYAVADELSEGQYKLTFLKGQRPEEHDTTRVYEVMDGYTSENLPPWTTELNNLYEVAVKDEFEAPQSLAYWFYNCEQIQSIDLSGLDTSNVNDFSNMFNGCSALKKIFVDTGFVCKDGAVTANMFGGNTFLEGGYGTTFASANIMTGDYARVDGGSVAPGYLTYYKYAVIFDANGGTGALEMMLSQDGSFTMPDTETTSASGYSFMGWSTNKNAWMPAAAPGGTFKSNGTAPCCETLYAVYDRPVTTGTSELFDAISEGKKNIVLEGGTYGYMDLDGYSTGLNITMNNVKCTHYINASKSNKILINSCDFTQSTTTTLIPIGRNSTVTINDATTKNNSGELATIENYGTLIINGGTYNRSVLVREGYANSNLTINGGTFTNITSLGALAGNVGNVTITGGTFGFDPTDSGHIAEGYTVVDNGDGTWTVIPDANAASTQPNDPPAN